MSRGLRTLKFGNSWSKPCCSTTEAGLGDAHPGSLPSLKHDFAITVPSICPCSFSSSTGVLPILPGTSEGSQAQAALPGNCKSHISPSRTSTALTDACALYYIGLAKKFIRFPRTIVGKNPNELFGQHNTFSSRPMLRLITPTWS